MRQQRYHKMGRKRLESHPCLTLQELGRSLSSSMALGYNCWYRILASLTPIHWELRKVSTKSVSSDTATRPQYPLSLTHSVAGELRLVISPKEHKGASKMAQQVKAFATELDDLSL